MTVTAVQPQVVVIAERIVAKSEVAPASNRALRMMTVRYIDQLEQQILTAGFGFVGYDELGRLLEHLTEHRGDVVLSLWHGDRSRNAVTLVPSICEAAGIPVIGADSYARMVCDDKFLSRELAGRIGFRRVGWLNSTKTWSRSTAARCLQS